MPSIYDIIFIVGVNNDIFYDDLIARTDERKETIKLIKRMRKNKYLTEGKDILTGKNFLELTPKGEVMYDKIKSRMRI